MRTTKQTVIELEDGDTILIRGGGTSFSVQVDSDRCRGLALDDVQVEGAEFHVFFEGKEYDAGLVDLNTPEFPHMFDARGTYMTVYL